MDATWDRVQQDLRRQRIVADGSKLSLWLGIVILGTVYYNAQILHDDYPPVIKAQAVPMSARDKQERVVASVLFLGSFVGGIVRSNLRLRARNGGRLSFGAAFCNAYAVFVFCNAFDLLVLDYLVLLGLKPAWAILPGTEDMAQAYVDYRFHFIGFLKGSVYGIVPSLVFALGTRRGCSA